MIGENIETLIANARKSGDAKRLLVLGNIKAALDKERTKESRHGKPLSDDDELKVLLAMQSQYNDAIAIYAAVKDTERVAEEQFELNILNTYIPDQPTDEEIADFADEVCVTFMHDAERPLAMSDMKTILSMVHERYPLASGKIVSQVVKSRI